MEYENEAFQCDNPKEIRPKSDEVKLKMADVVDVDYEEKETTIEFCSLEPNTNEEEPTQAEKNLTTVVDTTNKGNVLMMSQRKINTEEGSVTSSFGANEATKDGFMISWQNLSYVVESKWYKLTSQKKPILDRLSGSIKSGELTAILGPSGAGKSTFIDCLVGKHHSRGMSGRTEVRFNDSLVEEERRRNKPFKIVIIPQADHLLDSLTVTETLMFASRIKNAHLTYEDEDGSRMAAADLGPSKRREFDHVGNVQRVIKQLDLSSCASTRCGKLSGGQYKRVSIGQELLSRPDLMILDEPTSGLDSVTCYQTVKALRQLIDSSPYPMAIVSTIHQPDIEVFSLFHKAYVLASGGRAIFEGPTEAIFEQVTLGAELVEARRRRLHGSSSSSSFLETSVEWKTLQRQLAAPEHNRGNPARLIVEVAANKFGLEIANALNELQVRSQANSSSPATSRWAAKMAAVDLDASKTRADSAISSNPSTSSSSTAAEHHASGFGLFQEASLVESGAPEFSYQDHEPRRRRQATLDQLLSLRSANGASGSGRSWRCWWRHLMLHTSRSWVTIVRDPMLFAMQLFLHVAVPLLISYSFQIHKQTDACPRVGPLDVVAETFREGNVLDELRQELREVFENIGYIFFQVYVIIFAAVCVTSLTYPLCMHVLLKEYRNGWYSMSSYFLGRTLADLPVPTFNVLLAMAISYHLTGQPVDQYDWRFWSAGWLTVLATLVAQTMGLMFGAMLMNAPQSAVFVAPASTAPLVVVCGFLLRIKSLPPALQMLSQLSYFTHLINGVIVSRYGFNRCPCEEADFRLPDESHELPRQARNLIDMWAETFGSEFGLVGANGSEPVRNPPDLVGKLLTTIDRAKTFNYDIADCSQVKPYIMLDYELEDHHLFICFGSLVAMLFAFRWLTYMVLSWKINTSI